MAATKSKKSAPTSQDLISAYMHAQLDGSKPCTNVYQFCQIAGCTESDFYAQFSDLSHLKSSIWEAFMGQASDLVAQSPDFQQAPAQEKALSLLFTLFEVMTAYRTYILHNLYSSIRQYFTVVNHKEARGSRTTHNPMVRMLEKE